jgi:hypothetical protein|tara:strand:- start:8549 stop:8650 length:102 start_codon:yes stop_codon:yes gene_type:complete
MNRYDFTLEGKEALCMDRLGFSVLQKALPVSYI